LVSNAGPHKKTSQRDGNDRLKFLHSPTNRRIKSKISQVWYGTDKICRLYIILGWKPDEKKLHKRRRCVLDGMIILRNRKLG